jgi:uncharacterized protein
MALTGHIECILDEDALKAHLRYNTNDTGPEWDPNAVKRLLAENKVVEGFSDTTIEEALKSFAKTEQFPASYTVATGEPPELPEPEAVEWQEVPIPEDLEEDSKRVLAAAPPPDIFKIKTEKSKTKKLVTKKPKLPFMPAKQEEVTVTETKEVRESVNIDPEVVGIGWVEAGAVIAKISPAIPGKPGRSVLGQPIQPPANSDDAVYPGNGIEDTKKEFRAGVTGFLRRGKNWVEVIPFRTHAWTIEQSADKTTFYLAFEKGNEQASLPSGEEVRTAAEEAGADPEKLNTPDGLDRLLFDYLGSGKDTFRIPLTNDRDCMIEITTTEDGLRGLLNVCKGSGGGKALVLKEVGAAIKASGFKGMNLEKIRNDLLEFYKGEQEELTDYVLAEGKAPTAAGERTLECSALFMKSEETAAVKARAAALEAAAFSGVESIESWPIAEVEKMAYVKSDIIIATISQSGKGSEGTDVFGKPIPFEEGSDFGLELGEGLKLDETSVATTATGILDFSESDKQYRMRVRPHRDPFIKVTISADRMSASVDLIAPEGTGEPLTVEKVLEAAETNGITKAVKPEAIEEAVRIAHEKGSVEGHHIADGEPPQDPAESSITMLIQLATKKHVTIDKNGKANFKNQDIITTIEAGTRIAEIASPKVEPKDGWDVTGKVIKAKPIRKLELEIGANVKKVAEGDKDALVAETGGELLYDGKSIEIRDTHMEEGDVGLKSGNIKFPGSVGIKGNVQAGFYVFSGKDIMIGQSIEGALLSADGSISIGQGVKGGGKAVLRAKKEIEATFIENATVLAVGDLKLKKSCFGSKITCNGWVRTPEGSLIGGMIKARRGVEAHEIGSEREVDTTLSFGQDFLMENQIEAEEREIQKLKTKIVKLDGLMTKLETEGNRDKLNRARKEKVKSMKLIEKRTIRLFTYREKFEEHFPSEIIVHGSIYPGVTIECHGRLLEIQQKKSNLKISFDSEKGRIVEEPLPKDAKVSTQAATAAK